MTSWESQVNAFKSAIKFGGHDSIDIVCAAAGVPGAPFIMPKEEAATLVKDPREPRFTSAVFNVNVKGVYFTSKLSQHYFGLKTSDQQQERYKKVLIMISSLAGYFEIDSPEYVASKWVIYVGLAVTYPCNCHSTRGLYHGERC